MQNKFKYDLISIGSGPGGQKAVIQAAKLGKKAAIIDFNPFLGGVCLHDGTIPSKSFREAILHLTGYRERTHYGRAYSIKHDVNMQDLTDRCGNIIKDCEQTIRAQMQRNHIDVIEGYGSFVDQNTVKVTRGDHESLLTSENIVIATGTRPWQPEGFDFDGEVILDSDSILHMKRLPKSLSIVGGGVIGCEYGSMFATLGIKVTIVEARSQVLGFVDSELVDSLVYKLREQKVVVITNDKVIRCTKSKDGRAVTYLESGKRIVTEKLLISAGRQGNVEKLNLDAVGVIADRRGKVEVNEFFQTSCPNIYAVGDVVGAPALASTSMEQGRRATCHAFDMLEEEHHYPLPSGIYTVPEIATVGKTEAELSAEKIPYEKGIGRFSEVERGKIIGDDSGVLKILFDRNTLKLLGVHCIGESAAELVHIGQAVMSFGGTIEYLCEAVFNYPTLGQAYKIAALDGMNKVVATRGLDDQDTIQDLARVVEKAEQAKVH